MAGSKSEPHLLAIAGRWWLKEVITDVSPVASSSLSASISEVSLEMMRPDV